MPAFFLLFSLPQKETTSSTGLHYQQGLTQRSLYEASVIAIVCSGFFLNICRT